MIDNHLHVNCRILNVYYNKDSLDTIKFKNEKKKGIERLQ